MILKKIIRMNWVVGLCVVLAMLLLAVVGDAKEGKGKAKGKSKPAKDTAQEEVVEVKKIEGEVVCFTPRKEPKFITITVDRNNEKIDHVFYIDKDVEIERKKSLKEINVGDTIEITYDVIKITEIAQEGAEATGEEEKVKTKRVAKVIRLVKIKAPEIEGVYRSGGE